MKKNYKYFIVLGLSLFAASVIISGDVRAQDNTVSVIGSPTTPAPAGPNDFPPQPVTVAPAEDAAQSPTTETPTTSATPATTSAAPAVAPVVVTDTPPPAPEDTSLTPIPDNAGGTITGTNVMGDSGAREKHSGTYYDSNAVVPDSDLAAAGAIGPRKVDPALEPGQKYIVVEKTRNASSFEAQYVAATRALKLGRYAAAMEMFEKLYKKSHKDPRILMGLAVAQQGAGFNESAANTYEDLLKVEPNNADAIVNLMGIMKAQYPSVTLKKLMELRGKYPMNPGIPAQIGMLNAEQKNYEDAIRYLEIAASMEPTNSSHIYNMAIALDRAGNAPKAIKLYEQALQMDASYGSEATGLPREQIYDRLVVLRRKV